MYQRTLFLLRDIGSAFLEMDNEKREQLIQSGIHYSEIASGEATIGYLHESFIKR